ncbi:ABC transporter permease [Rhizobium puerariae]|uniref:ABC transporter permease n=1 Tax=Rhizobium puerariae TaxID=1585791 RepID=A0ABV6ARL5_9HYPH
MSVVQTESETAIRPAVTTARRSAATKLISRILSTWMARIGAVLLLAIILAAIFAPVLTPYDPLVGDMGDMIMPPTLQHPFGTDELGRDILARILYGARISLIEGFFPVIVAIVIGAPIGMLAGYVGGMTDRVIMRFIDVLLAFPGVLLAIVIVSILGPGLFNALIAVAIYTIPIFARLARGATLSVVNEPYIEAAKLIGMSHARILRLHVFPNISSTLFVMATLRVGLAILTASSLSFLGLGAQAPSPEWGAMLANGRSYILIAPHMVIFPGLAIVILVLALNFFQNGVRLALDPKAAI